MQFKLNFCIKNSFTLNNKTQKPKYEEIRISVELATVFSLGVLLSVGQPGVYYPREWEHFWTNLITYNAYLGVWRKNITFFPLIQKTC